MDDKVLELRPVRMHRSLRVHEVAIIVVLLALGIMLISTGYSWIFALAGFIYFILIWRSSTIERRVIYILTSDQAKIISSRHARVNPGDDKILANCRISGSTISVRHRTKIPIQSTEQLNTSVPHIDRTVVGDILFERDGRVQLTLRMVRDPDGVLAFIEKMKVASGR